jgi:aminoglycoside phosphotransferase (APT) family kinase protein
VTPEPVVTDDLAGIDLPALRTYLDDSGVTTAGVLSASLVGGGRSNLTFRVTDGASRWILRRPPLGHVERGAHDVSREFRVMAGLAGSAVPVPTPLVLTDDASVIGASFYVMDEVAGDVLRTRDDTEALTVAQRRGLGEALVDTLADLHDIDPGSAGLGALGRPDGYLQRQLDRWRRQFHAVAVRDLPEVDLVLDALQRTLPESGPAAVVHGDYRLDNVMVDAHDPTRLVAVLDWEMATLGDPLADLATLVMFWDEPGRAFNPITGGLTAFEGFPTVDEVVARYVARRGVDADRLGWYLCFAQVRMVVILEQMHARFVAGDTVGGGFEHIDVMSDQILAGAVAATSAL